MATHIFKVRGMTCDHCVQALTSSLTAVPGVQEARVDLKTGTARVNHDDRENSVGDLMAAVLRAGFEVDGFQTDKPSASDPTR
jgi:copper chaperone